MIKNSKYEDIMGKIIFNKYRPEKKLGEGSFGKIFVATNLQDNQKYALKIVTFYIIFFFIIRKQEMQGKAF